MKAITKLLLVALLIGVALSLPTKVKASGSNYICNWQGFGQCVGQLQQWLQGCTQDCSEYNDSGPGEFCETITTYSGGPAYNPEFGSVAVSSETDCWYVNINSESCVSVCADSYNNQFRNNCLADNCSED